MNESGHNGLAISKALKSFLKRTCLVCKKRLYVLGPCKYCRDKSFIFNISYKDIPNNWSFCEFRISIVERDIKNNKRSYEHKKSSRKDFDLLFRKKMGGDGRFVCELLIFDRMKKTKMHQVRLIDGTSYMLVHDEFKRI